VVILAQLSARMGRGVCQKGLIWAFRYYPPYPFGVPHAQHIYVCDFTIGHDLPFHPIELLVVMHLATRQIKHLKLTRHPTGTWMAQQLRAISAWGEGPRCLVCDHEAIFDQAFEEIAAGVGTEIIHTPLYTPQATGHCERLMGRIKRECLGSLLILHESQLRRVMKEYAAYYNTARPPQGLGQKIPAEFYEGATIFEKEQGQALFVTPFLKGLHHSYSWTRPPA
jgi:putative transposase